MDRKAAQYHVLVSCLFMYWGKFWAHSWAAKDKVPRREAEQHQVSSNSRVLWGDLTVGNGVAD
jgi:hypothetical protein